MSSPFTNRRLTFWESQYNVSGSKVVSLTPYATTLEGSTGNIYVEPRAGSDHRDTALFSAFLATVRQPFVDIVCFQAHDQFYNASLAVHVAEEVLADQSSDPSRHTEILEAFNTVYTPEHELTQDQILLIGNAAILLCDMIKQAG